MVILGLAMNAVVTALLLVTIVYCWRVDRRLRALRSGQDGMKELIAGLDRATVRAQAGLSELKAMGLSAEGALKSEIKKADTLLDELKLMVQSADRVADRLAQVRPSAAPTASKPAPSPVKDVHSPIFDALRQAR